MPQRNQSFVSIIVSCLVSLTLFDSFYGYNTVQLLTATSSSSTFNVPKTIGDNGYWMSDSPKNMDTHLEGIAAAHHVTELIVCLSGSGAVTHVNYCSDPKPDEA